jgi:hypothetical protein
MPEVEAGAAHSGDPGRDLEVVLVGERDAVLEGACPGHAAFHAVTKGKIVHREDLPARMFEDAGKPSGRYRAGGVELNSPDRVVDRREFVQRVDHERRPP